MGGVHGVPGMAVVLLVDTDGVVNPEVTIGIQPPDPMAWLHTHVGWKLAVADGPIFVVGPHYLVTHIGPSPMVVGL